MIIVNANGFYEPLRALIEGAIAQDFIQEKNRGVALFVDPPAGEDQEHFDWGTATLKVLEEWKPQTDGGLFDWGPDKMQAS